MKLKLKLMSLFVATILSVVSVNAADKGNEVINSIMTRTSVRSYTSKPVEPEKIETMLRAAMAAPTGMNRQPWEFVVVTNREALDKIPSIIKGARSAAKAQLAIVILGEPKKSHNWLLDCSAATENLLLAAHSMGLGAVWCGAYPDNAEGRVGQLRELLSFSAELEPLNVIVIGYPDKEPTIKDKWKPEKIHYVK